MNPGDTSERACPASRHLLAALVLSMGLGACLLPPAREAAAPEAAGPQAAAAGLERPALAVAAQTPVEILWDSWGVPHIYASTEADLFYAFGWAQMRSHGNLILEIYGRARGRAAEYWGQEHLASDLYMRTIGVPSLAAKLHEAGSLQDAMASGMNAYAEAHPEALDDRLEAVLPLSGEDVTALTIYTIYSFYAPPDEIDAVRRQYLEGQGIAQAGPPSPWTSNAWLIGPSRSESGHPILLANPHVFWPGMPGFEHMVPYEVHLVGPDLDFYGAVLIGALLPSFGFNDYLGWTFTSTPLDVSDYYELTLTEDRCLFDGEPRDFQIERHLLKVRQEDGAIREESLEVRRSIHGPVIAAKEGKAVAVRLPELPFGERIQPLEMMRARSLDQFLEALELQQMTPLNFLYADRGGNIMYTLVGMIPDRPNGDIDWSDLIAGDTTATLWRGLLPYDRMPRIINPPTGYLQNTNDAPWTATLPSGLDQRDYPSDWPGPTIFPRAARSLEMIAARDLFSLEEVMADKFSTRSLVAERVLDDLIAAARRSGSSEAQEAAAVLSRWDRSFEADSPGSALFAFWAMQLQPDILGAGVFPEEAYAQPTDPVRPLATPRGLADPGAAVAALQGAAQAVRQVFGTLDVPWGAFVRFRVGSLDLPGFGQGWGPFGLGSFTPNLAVPSQEGPLVTVYGDTWVAAIEFSDPVRAMAVMPYGNATQPGSPHVGDQLPLYAAKRYRPVWRSRADVQANLELREVLSRPAACFR